MLVLAPLTCARPLFLESESPRRGLGYSDLPTNMDVAVTNGNDLCGDAL